MSLSSLGVSVSSAYSSLTLPSQTSTDTSNADTSSADTDTPEQDPALAGSSNSLQAIFALTQGAPGVTAALVSQVTTAALNAPADSASTDAAQTFGIVSTDFAPVAQPDATFTGSPTPATAQVATAATSAGAADAGSTSAILAGSSSTTTTNSDGTEMTTTFNADGSVTVETTGAPTTSVARTSSQSSVDDSYLAYLTVPTIPVDNSVDYSDS
jgi:hypothetical protein